MAEAPTQMDTVQCTCSNCQQLLGTCFNLWTQIGKSYFSPVASTDTNLNVQIHGTPRVGDEATLVEGCSLQDIVCKRCKVVVGIKCLDTPKNHVLDRNQLILRQAAFSAVNEKGNAVELNISRSLSLKSEAKYGYSPFTPASEDFDALDIQAQVETQRADIDRIDNAGIQVVSAIESLRHDLGSHRADLATVQSNVRQIQRLVETRGGEDNASKTSLGRMRKQLESSNKTIEDMQHSLSTITAQLRKELAASKTEVRQLRRQLDSRSDSNAAAIEKQARALAGLRAEMADFRQQVQRQQQEQTEGVVSTVATAAVTMKPGALVLGSHELDVITGNISNLSSRASQIEPLQMEVTILKSRLQRLEYFLQSEDTTKSHTYTFDETGSTVSSMGSSRKRRTIEEVYTPTIEGPDMTTLPTPLSTRTRKKRSMRSTKAGF